MSVLQTYRVGQRRRQYEVANGRPEIGVQHDTQIAVWMSDAVIMQLERCTKTSFEDS